MCNPCTFRLDAASRAPAVVIDERIVGAGGFDTGTKDGWAVARIGGDSSAVTLAAVVSYSRASTTDQSTMLLAAQPAARPAHRRIVRH